MFRNKTKWKLQATKTWVTTFFAGTTLQKAKQQTNIWELLYDWLQGISREQVCAGVRGKSVPLLKREYPEASPLNPPPTSQNLLFLTLIFWWKPCFPRVLWACVSTGSEIFYKSLKGGKCVTEATSKIQENSRLF